ncbi:hypothetical protein [Streptomyces griseofuscus]|uniref:hypothetical protein n=1 Tax=Streptomyces griseofuscus TaxID=146922 RepID=UPI00155A6DF8|nr:hypothetical protein [Streptomyces griseofuscus]
MPRSVHHALGLLLEHAEPEHAAAALAALPERVTGLDADGDPGSTVEALLAG